MRDYRSDATEVAFLLGGIGTGNISIGSRGNFRDIEVFNSPNKGMNPAYTFFVIRIVGDSREPIYKKLEAKPVGPYSKSHGFSYDEVKGIPHIESSLMSVRYPFVSIDFFDKDIPLKINLEAFTPFIPLNPDDSGIPAFLLRYSFNNTSKKDIEISIAASMANMLGNYHFSKYGYFIGSENEIDNIKKEETDLGGINYIIKNIKKDNLLYGNMTLALTDSEITSKTKWLTKGWSSGIQDFWDDFKEDGQLNEVLESDKKEIGNLDSRSALVGSIASQAILKPGQSKTFQFIISWYFPNRPADWKECSYPLINNKTRTIKNYYAGMFSSSWDVAKYLTENIDRLEKCSRDFSRALYTSTLPDFVLDALSSNITILRSPTCYRISDGTFLGWEGCCDSEGSCPGSCTHVWNYAQTVAFLFPKLEQSMRRVEFEIETDNKGKMNFRSIRVLGKNKWENKIWNNLPPATDGQLGTIIRLYREWKISGNSKLLKDLWKKTKKVMDYAIRQWDKDRDSVLDGIKHNTYDIEFHGPEPLSNSLFYAALKAAIRMSEYMKDKKEEEKYKKILNQGRNKMDRMLWKGEYYIQKIKDINQYKYQFGKGCLSDQLFGQLLSHICNLGYILPKDHVKKAIKAVYDNNFKDSLKDHDNVQRVFALGNEAGLLLCSWPEGGRPKFPFIYSDEVWSGVEYQVATHLIYEGYLAEAFNIVKAVRNRYDGYKRNPFNEVECGYHYVRPMSSWGLLIALSGFEYDLVKNKIYFNPKINQDNFSCFFSTGKGWGIYRQKKNESGRLSKDIEVLYGNMDKVELER